MGSLRYAGALFHTRLFVVLGHEGGGAVQAALDFKHHRAKQHSRIQFLGEHILLGLADSDQRLTKYKLLASAVEANVR
jgi:carbonic anhydrase